MAHDYYLDGSVPMANAEAVFSAVGGALGTAIKQIPDGETGERLDWITWLEIVFANSPALEQSDELFRVHATGTARKRYKLRAGKSIADIHFDNLFYADTAKESYASFKRLRPWSYKFREEQAAIDAWLDLVARAAARSPDLALEVADCARLIKGYGDTLKRGQGNYRTIVTRVIEPALASTWPPSHAADAVASARAAALADPEGDSLARTIGEIETRSRLEMAAE